MFRFFRKIRYKLLDEQKLSKYTYYAIGEILLVVIGILIALAVNNWNEERKDDNSSRELLTRIQRDLRQDITHFEDQITKNASLREEIKLSLQILYRKVDSIDKAKQVAEIYDHALDQVFSPNDDTYQSMLSSDTLRHIKNEDLKEAIISHYSNYEETQEILASINRWMEGLATELDIQTDFMKFNALINDIYTTDSMFNESDLKFMNDKEDPRFKILIRAISATAFNQKVRSSYYQELIPKCQTLIDYIENELKQD